MRHVVLQRYRGGTIDYGLDIRSRNEKWRVISTHGTATGPLVDVRKEDFVPEELIWSGIELSSAEKGGYEVLKAYETCVSGTQRSTSTAV